MSLTALTFASFLFEITALIHVISTHTRRKVFQVFEFTIDLFENYYVNGDSICNKRDDNIQG